MWEGIMPILHSSGFIIPGQFGPINLLFYYFLRTFLTSIISCWGIPSVMATINSISALIASNIASFANRGGTYITVASQPVLSFAS